MTEGVPLRSRAAAGLTKGTPPVSFADSPLPEGAGVASLRRCGAGVFREGSLFGLRQDVKRTAIWRSFSVPKKSPSVCVGGGALDAPAVKRSFSSSFRRIRNFWERAVEGAGPYERIL